ncbi:unnamed protein product [Paramecium primaurelia]|uniref:Mannosyl-oligosaccharide glucosidase n=1 Tax=Paramecium primaurelia TaxID=5886 RepID=A0A8S1JT17_PARPR|nr:unnamed protein product [Paramecium primaurelia]
MIVIIFTIISIILCDFDESMRWGTYKPQLLHAVTQRNMKTFNPITGALMYADHIGTDDRSLVYKIPDLNTEQVKINPVHHNGKDFNVQLISDPNTKSIIQTTFIKFPMESKVNFVDEIKTLVIEKPLQLFYVLTIEQFNQFNLETRTFQVNVTNNGIRVSTYNEDETRMEHFFITITVNDRDYQYNCTDEKISNLTIRTLFNDYIFNYDPRPTLMQAIFSNSTNTNNSNLVAIEFRAQPGDNIIIQVTQTDKYIPDYGFDNLQQLSDSLAAINKFNFKKVFGTDNKCAYSSFNNLMAGLLFTYGNLSCVINKDTCTAFKPMLSHTPSRFGFPRPFLWDEGFHNMIACKMNPDICLQSLEDWINTMSIDGWIPREQPRSEELRSYIPWLKEDPRESNPPTFFFNFEYLIDNHPQYKERIGRIYLKLFSWYNNWFRTQAISDEKGKFSGYLKWWGPDEDSNLGSGLDDWPRTDGSKVSKYNIDAQSWGYFFTYHMVKLARIYDIGVVNNLEERMQLILNKMNSDMLDPNDLIYKDILYYPNTDDQVFYSPHRGYVNLFPLGLGLIDKQRVDIIQQYINFMRGNTMWTQFGIRSLETNSTEFRKKSNYWTGPIWVNIQFLVLRALKLYYWEIDGVQQFYQDLRHNMIETICSQYETRGYFYEHYNQNLDGLGQGNRPFNGWTSLITLIIAEKY